MIFQSPRVILKKRSPLPFYVLLLFFAPMRVKVEIGRWHEGLKYISYSPDLKTICSEQITFVDLNIKKKHI